MNIIPANNDSSVYRRQVAGTRSQIFGQDGVHDVLVKFVLLDERIECWVQFDENILPFIDDMLLAYEVKYLGHEVKYCD